MRTRTRSLAAAAAVAAGVAVVGWTSAGAALLKTDDFMPHGHCYRWLPALVWLHAGADVAIGLAYVAISATLARLVRRARGEIPFDGMLLAFGTFIVACGAGHLLDAWTLWVPRYWLSGGVKLLTAVVSVATAVALPRLVPKALGLLAAARAAETDRRKAEAAESALRRANDALERRVRQRTAELRVAEATAARHRHRMRSLYEVAADATKSEDEQIAAALRLGCEWFGVDIGIVIRVDGNVGTVEHVYTRGAALQPGQAMDITETYTGITMAAGAPVSFHDVADSPYRDHPARRMMKMPSFVGVPFEVHGRTFGVLSFSGVAPLPAPLEPADHDVVALLGRWVGTMIERRQSAAELAGARDAALESARLKSEFVATMSHELRTPLNIIMGYTEMLADQVVGPLTARQGQLLGHVQQQSCALLELITTTLDIGRLESGRDGVAGVPFDPAALAREVDAELRPLAPAGVALEWTIDGPEVLADRAKVKTILKNLVGNALKFTDAGAVAVTLRTTGRTLALRVVDTGVGIPADQLPVVFEMFRQADGSSTRRHGGVGLGLHIVRRLVTLLDGTIGVESEPGRGSTFTVVLPVAPVSAFEPVRASA